MYYYSFSESDFQKFCKISASGTEPETLLENKLCT
jgi:hypothetical protein